MYFFRAAFCLLGFLLFFVAATFAQAPLPKYEIGVNAGALIYQGDLAPSPAGSFKTPSFVFGLNGSRMLTTVFAARLDLSFGRLRGDDALYSSPEWRKQRAFAFTTPLTELTASLLYYPLGLDHKFSPYLFAGFGLAAVNIKRDYSRYNAAYFLDDGVNTDLQQDLAHKLPRTIPVIPMGIGLRYPLTEKFSLTSEAAYRNMSTDYLDGFSKAGNPGRNDHYYKFSLGLHYLLGVKDRYACPAAVF